MGIEIFLDLTWVDVLSSPDDHVFHAPHDTDIAILVHRS